MSLSSALVPDSRLIIQTGFFVASLFSINFFIVSPLMRLHAERKKRTSGSLDLAREAEAKAIGLQASFDQKWKAALDDSRQFREQQVAVARSEGDKIIEASAHQAKIQIEDMQRKVNADLASQRAQIPSQIDGLVEKLWGRLSTVFLVGFVAAYIDAAHAAGGGGAEVEFWSGIFWPYFQFLCFAGALIFFARGPISKMLDGQRTQFRAKLSEAKQALHAAEAKTQELTSKLDVLQSELEKLKAETAQSSKNEHAKILDESQRASEQLMKDAQRLTQNMVESHSEQLKSEMIDMVMAAFHSKMSSEKLSVLDAKFKSQALQEIRNLQ